VSTRWKREVGGWSGSKRRVGRRLDREVFKICPAGIAGNLFTNKRNLDIPLKGPGHLIAVPLGVILGRRRNSRAPSG
jgi:hypothetical protein